MTVDEYLNEVSKRNQAIDRRGHNPTTTIGHGQTLADVLHINDGPVEHQLTAKQMRQIEFECGFRNFKI